MLKDRILIVGVGQCGNNIAKEFEKLDYNVFYINSSFEDLKTLKTDEEKMYHIPNASGCAKDRDKATNYAVGYYDNIINLIDNKFPTCDIVFFTYSLGGGTGGGITNILLDTITAKNENKLYGAITVLPHNSECIMVQTNAKASLEQLADIQEKLYSIHILDNNKSQENDFSDINSEIAQNFDRLIDFNETSAAGNIDGFDMESLVTEAGNSVILDIDDIEEDFQVALIQAVEDSVYASWVANCNGLGLILKEGNNKFDCLKSTEEIFGVPIKDFITFSKENSVVIASGMSLNNKALITKLIKNANEKIRLKKELEEQSESEQEEICLDTTLLNNRRKRTPRKKNNENISKELNSIINKYKNI